jgi:hypothetical protein
MNKAIDQFKKNIDSLKSLDFIYNTLKDKPELDLSEILRAELVLAVAAMDCFIHDLVRMRMSEIFQAVENKPDAFLNFNISLKAVEEIFAASTKEDRIYSFEQEIRRLHGYRTFQRSDNISQALSLIGVKSVWDKAGKKLGLSTANVRNQLDLIVQIRDRIAHESDIDPSLGIGEKYPIDFEMVDDSIKFLEDIADTVYSVIVSELTS